MSDFSATGGSIRISDGIKSPVEYAPARSVSFELAFTLASDLAVQEVEAAVNNLSALVERRVNAAIRKDFTDPNAAVDAQVASIVRNPPDIVGEPEPAKRGRGRPRKNSAAGSYPEADGGTAGGGNTPETAADPFAPSEPRNVAENPTPQEAATASGATNEAASSTGDASPTQESDTGSQPSITDQELHHAITARVPAVGKDGIKTLIAGFRPEGVEGHWSVANLNQPQRVEFLVKLAELPTQ